jgi:hypothetical protein
MRYFVSGLLKCTGLFSSLSDGTESTAKVDLIWDLYTDSVVKLDASRSKIEKKTKSCQTTIGYNRIDAAQGDTRTSLRRIRNASFRPPDCSTVSRSISDWTTVIAMLKTSGHVLSVATHYAKRPARHPNRTDGNSPLMLFIRDVGDKQANWRAIMKERPFNTGSLSSGGLTAVHGS